MLDDAHGDGTKPGSDLMALLHFDAVMYEHLPPLASSIPFRRFRLIFDSLTELYFDTDAA